MEKFRTATYEVHNPKIKKSVRFAVLADLHGSIFGEENSALLKKIQENAPDAILLAGDMVVRMDPPPWKPPGSCFVHWRRTSPSFTPWETTKPK